MLNPQLSIIIPVYNVEQYINQCIESILAQKYQDYEIILIDDGSTDCSGEICDNFARKDHKIKVIHKVNGGVSSARNIGLQMFSGSYVTFIDPDDFIEVDTYTKNINILLNNKEIDILQYPCCRYFHPQHIEDDQIPNRLIIGKEQMFSNWWAGNPIHYSTCNKIFKRNIFNRIRFLEGHLSEDTRLLVDLCKVAHSIYLSDQGKYFYRAREGSHTYTYSFNTHIDLFNAHFEIYKELIKYSSLIPQRAIAFNRIFRRLIQAQISNPRTNLFTEYQHINSYFPTWKDIYMSQSKDKQWLSIAKILGAKRFATLFIYYLKFKKITNKKA